LDALTLYGDKSQYDRTIVMNAFKNTAPILIATDIAARGIDVKAIKTVLNYECPTSIELYIHRIGRAGRAGDTGTSISFLDKKASSIKFAIQLVKIFENSGYPVNK
jgi:superfamily II DNA/RNA helicase